jgi:Bacteriophage replication protein O
MPPLPHDHTGSASAWTFRGVTSPNTTQVPNQYLDELLSVLSGAELKVLLYITRRTFGFMRQADNISISQMLTGITTADGRVLDHGVGLSKKTLLHAIKSLVEKQVILTERRRSVERGDEPTTYRLNIAYNPDERSSPQPVGEKLHQVRGVLIPPHKRKKNKRNISNIRMSTIKLLTEIRRQ